MHGETARTGPTGAAAGGLSQVYGVFGGPPRLIWCQTLSSPPRPRQAGAVLDDSENVYAGGAWTFRTTNTEPPLLEGVKTLVEDGVPFIEIEFLSLGPIQAGVSTVRIVDTATNSTVLSLQVASSDARSVVRM